MLSRSFDALFHKHAGAIPVAYLRALAHKESGMNPRQSSGPAWGLLQITGIARKDYNRTHGTSYTQADLLNPAVNIKIAAWLLNKIVRLYSRNHSDRNMQPDWSNPEFVKLVTAGWNSGYSEGGGVGKVASVLESLGKPVTHDNVFKFSQIAGATRHLANEAKRRWQAGVADLFYREGGPAAVPASSSSPSSPSSPSSSNPTATGAGAVATVALLGFVAWGAYTLLK